MSEKIAIPTLLQRLYHFEQHQLKQGDEYGAEVLHNTAAELNRLESVERKYEVLVDGINNLPRYYIETTFPMMDKGPSIRWNVRKGGEWVRDHQLRALLGDDDG